MGAFRDAAKRLGNTLLWGWRGVPAPTGIATSEAWLAEHPERGWRHSLSEARVIEYETPPTQTPDAPPGELEREAGGGEIRLAPEFVFALRGGRVAERTGSVLTPDGLLVGDVSLSAPDRESKILRRGPLPPARPVPGRLGVLAYPKCGDFYHWMIDTLPRLRLLRDLPEEVDRWYAPVGATFQRGCLELLGIDPSRVVPATRFAHVSADELVVPSGGNDQPHPNALRFLREALLPPVLERTRAAGPGKLYISRGRARWRRVVNESELMARLEREGFERIFTEELSIAEQIRRLHEARVVVSPHGAALSLLAFCEPGTRVLEIGTSRRPHDFFWQICAQLGLPYVQLLGTPVRTRRGVWDSDVEVDLPRLRACLDWLEHAETPEPPRPG